jgi:AcrR family transcriptional regulator
MSLAPARPQEAATGGTADRICEATLSCISQWGLAKTTLDDIARGAGCSRATVYRLFPGGKDQVVAAVIARESESFFAALSERLAAADGLEDLLVTGIAYAGSRLLEHEALQFMLAHEPDVILPAVAFTRLERVLALARDRLGPHLAPHLGNEEAGRSAEWVTRIVLSYSMCPAEEVDVRDEASVRRLVCSFVLPGLLHSDPKS